MSEPNGSMFPDGRARARGSSPGPVFAWLVERYGPSVDDLPDAVSIAETADEIHALREALAGKKGSQSDVDNDRPMPDPRPAREPRF
jgi:hypothetical protein